MPPKRKARGSATGIAVNTRKSTQSKRQKKESTSEDEHASDVDESQAFDKSSLQRIINYNFEELINDPTFHHPELVHQIKPEELNMDYFEKTGLEFPLFFRCDPKLLGMKVPDQSFSVNDVLNLIGGYRVIEIVEVKKQGSEKRTLKDFVDFYNTPPEKRKVLYNVLSLEYSLTPLEDLVQSPSLVREIDWVGTQWPDALKQRFISFNGRDKKQYTPHHTFPKVRNYCLMSVANCFTDFHIDFSGTSVWYHVLKGKKVFWLIPPTETNFILYQEFIKTMGDISFFGKSVEKCHLAVLEAGDTMLIPSGWIHAVFTPDDSLVFGGNFLHSYSCKMQIRVYQCENRLNITRKFRLPYNEELVFYVLANYVKKWTNREYARPLRIEDAKLDYVGEKWIAAGGHHKKIQYSDFAHGVQLTNEETDREEHTNELKVIAMHAENILYSSPDSLKKLKSSGSDGDLIKKEEDDYKVVVDDDEIARDAAIDELCHNNPLIFYKNSKHDFVHNKSVPDHKLPIGYEPPIQFNQEELDKISLKLLDELEALGTYMKRKSRVEVAEGICQPASLLHAFLSTLKIRRAQLEGKTIERREMPQRKYTRSSVGAGHFDVYGNPTAKNETDEEEENDGDEEVMENGNESPEPTPKQACARIGSRFNAPDFPDDFLEEEEPMSPIPQHNRVPMPEQPMSGALEYIAPSTIVKTDEGKNDEDDNEEEEVTTKKAMPRRSSRRASNKANAAIKEEIKEMEQVPSETHLSDLKEEAMEEELEMTWRQKLEKEEAELNEQKKKKDKDAKTEKKQKGSKKTGEEKQKSKKREAEKKRKGADLDAELYSAHGNSKSKKKKPDKPQFVGGLPVAPIQHEPVVSNPYNYDPKMEMVKLGTGQLKSAYRKSKNNVELRIEKNLYKLEPKKLDNEDDETGEDGHNASHDGVDHEQHEQASSSVKKNRTEPISIDILGNIPTSSKKVTKSDTQRRSLNSPPQQKKFSSPNLFSPISNDDHPKHAHMERRQSESTPHVRRMSTFNPVMSRQDRMIADAPPSQPIIKSPITPGSRHSSFSGERRPNFMTQVSPGSRTSSVDTPSTPYTPTAPPRTSWLPQTSIERRSTAEDSPIDVVNDEISQGGNTPIDIVNSPEVSTTPTLPPPPPSRIANNTTNGRRSSDASVIAAKREYLYTSTEAIQELRTLTTRLNQLNQL